MPELTDDELLSELGVEVNPAIRGQYTPREERIIAGFEEIQRFFDEHRRLPQHGEHLDIFERLYAVRLDRIRSLPEALSLLAPFDGFGLLKTGETQSDETSALDDGALLSELGVELAEETNIAVLKHVISREEKRAAEEIANRTRCEEFDEFEPLFSRAESELQSGLREARRFSGDINIAKGEFFILGGQMAYVAEKGQEFKTSSGETDARLRLIYSNGTESNLLLRSLQRALYKDESGRRLSDPNSLALFGETFEDGDMETGTIYVLRSLSNHPLIAEHQNLIHKIGVTSGKVEARISQAAHDPTYLLAQVEVVATYKLANVNQARLEGFIHRIFASAQVDITVKDRFGSPFSPKEWFLVPLAIIDQAIERLRSGEVDGLVYDPTSASLITLPPK